ncbi:unnamed protein product [Blepharisma stoltei]|uniref:Uncharacterized protein n=1 Tax=Blepharisma stoltei TaxID=1481888 RepID=A0AAU9K9S6_9CILI|nr:unnamed protein product [Blepharisma stoltei]
MNISDIIPRINISILPLFEPVVIYFNHKKTVLVHTARKSKSDTIHMILVLTDKSEIKKWKSQVNNEQVEYFCNSPKILKEIPTEISENQPTEYSKGKKLTFQINFIKKQQHISKASDLQNSEDFDEEKILSLAPASSGCSLSVSSESNFKLGSASKYILSTSKSIKKFQWILFFAVLFK